MDKASLVRSDREIEGLILQALSKAKVPITLCVWHYAEERAEWQLVIATPWYDSKGPRTASFSVFKALEAAGVYKAVPLRRVSVRSPKDSTVKALEQEIKDLDEGAIHIVEISPKRLYSVIFSPYRGQGGAVPAKQMHGLDELRAFLEKNLHIARSSVDQSLADLSRKGNTSISSVQLTNRQAKRLRLA